MIAEAAPRGRSVSASELLFRKVLRGLYDGRYMPGQRLLEIDLAREYDATRFVVREAFARLAAEGVVVTAFNRGAHIPRLTRKQATDTLLVMEHVLALAAELAAPLCAASPDADALNRAAADLGTFGEADDLFEFGRTLSAFFRALTRISGNEELQRLLTGLRVHLIRVQFRGFPSVVETHRIGGLIAIRDAVAAGDARGAGACTRRYFTSLARDMAALPDHAFAQS